MAKWEHISVSVPPPHLPPVEACVILTQDAKGVVRPVEKFPTPVDDNGIPNPYESLRLLASLIDSSYELPNSTNVHHQVHYRSEYQEKDERTYRESPSLMMNMPVQLHNLDHAVLLRAPKPSARVMEQYNREQRAISILFKLGSASLRNTRLADTLRKEEPVLGWSGRQDLHELLANAIRRERTKRQLYEKMLSRTEVGHLGLMPDPDALGDMGMREATTHLGKIGGNEFLDFRRASQDFIRKYGIQQGGGSAHISKDEQPSLAA